MKNIKSNRFHYGILIGLIAAVFLSFTNFDAKCENLKESVLRLHILANSDSSEDQDLKLKVRDAVLKECSKELSACDDLDEAIITAKTDTKKIEDIADKVIKDNGFDYSSTVYIGKSFFETREYDNFTLPAGTYNSLIIKLGKAKGHNWWCVVFPSVCLPAASDAKLSDSADKSAAEMAENPQKYVMKFKTVEWYETVRKKFFK